MARPSQFAKPILLYALPLIGLALALGTIDLIVPRDELSIDTILAPIKAATPKFGAEVVAAFYHMAVAAAWASAICAISLWWCLRWIFGEGYRELTAQERPFFWSGLVFAVGLPLVFLAWHKADDCRHFAIDDCVTSELFKQTIQRARVYKATFAFGWDSDLLACLVFTTYLIASLTVAVAVGTAPLGGKNDRSSGHSSLQALEQRTSILNTVLFLTTAVLILAMLAAKFRFDVGLATLVPAPTKEAPNLPFAAYQAVATAIMTYWATVLSLCLALIYLPGSYLLTYGSGNKSAFILSPILTPTHENFMRLLKLAAILSPPVINKLIEVISSVPKGV
jgi:hypothetical protein